MIDMQLRLFGKLALLLAPALPIMAQAGAAGQFDPDQTGWAHPPIVVLPAPAAVHAASVSPNHMLTAYKFSSIPNKGAGQIIGIVDAFDNPNAESDLATFTAQFGLASCTTANGCFKKIYASGTKPRKDVGWAGEISLDIEWSYAIAPQAKILLVEAASNANSALLHAVDVAVQNGATVVSMSWGGGEYSGEVSDDSHFNVTGVTFCASSGDGGHGVSYPAASPYVVSVGGTTLHVSTSGVWQSETVWSGSGGGASKYETKPSYQASAQTSGKRGVPDVALDANPSTGVLVYSQTGWGGWGVVGGTSLSSPVWAGLFAIVNSSRAALGKGSLTQPHFLLYPNAEANYHDIASGNNGTCGARCTAAAGYDFVTGVGSPQADLLIPAMVAAH